MADDVSLGYILSLHGLPPDTDIDDPPPHPCTSSTATTLDAPASSVSPPLAVYFCSLDGDFISDSLPIPDTVPSEASAPPVASEPASRSSSRLCSSTISAPTPPFHPSCLRRLRPRVDPVAQRYRTVDDNHSAPLAYSGTPVPASAARYETTPPDSRNHASIYLIASSYSPASISPPSCHDNYVSPRPPPSSSPTSSSLHLYSPPYCGYSLPPSPSSRRPDLLVNTMHARQLSIGASGSSLEASSFPLPSSSTPTTTLVSLKSATTPTSLPRTPVSSSSDNTSDPSPSSSSPEPPVLSSSDTASDPSPSSSSSSDSSTSSPAPTSSSVSVSSVTTRPGEDSTSSSPPPPISTSSDPPPPPTTTSDPPPPSMTTSTPDRSTTTSPDWPTTTSPDKPTTTSTLDTSTPPPPPTATTSKNPWSVSTQTFVFTSSVTTNWMTATSTTTTPRVWTSTFVYTSTIPGKATSTWIVVTSGSLSTQLTGTTTSRGVHSPGAIAGIVIGVLAALGFGALWLFLARRRLQRAARVFSFDPAGHRTTIGMGARRGPLDGEDADDDGPEEVLSRRGSGFLGSVSRHTTGGSGGAGPYGHGGMSGGGSGEEEMQSRYAGVLAALYPEVQAQHTGGSMGMAPSMSPSMVMAYANPNLNAQQPSSVPVPQVPPPVAQRGPHGAALYDANKPLPGHPPSVYPASQDPHYPSSANINADADTAPFMRATSPGLDAGAWLTGRGTAAPGLVHTLSVGNSSSGHGHSQGHTHSRSLSGHGHSPAGGPSQGNSYGHAMSSSGHGGYPASSSGYVADSSQMHGGSANHRDRLNRAGSSQSALLGPTTSTSRKRRKGETARGAEPAAAAAAPFKSVKDLLGRLRGGRGSDMSSSTDASSSAAHGAGKRPSSASGPVVGGLPPVPPIDLSSDAQLPTRATSNPRSLAATSEESHGGVAGAALKKTPTMNFVLSNPDMDPVSLLRLPLPRNVADEPESLTAAGNDTDSNDASAVPAAVASASSSAALVGGSARPDVPAWPFLPAPLAMSAGAAGVFPSAAPVVYPVPMRPGATPLQEPTLSSLMSASGPTPSPALSEVLARTDGLLRPGLLRYGENEGGRSVTTLRDFEDYSRPIGGLVNNRQDSRATLDTRTETSDLSDLERVA